mmetsp:Transcript_22153/g.30392  ORF Transcript_22153/g.30392 Transcript_22153/m.30392 type:complete len:105 (-) Transcript_22153:69-383(-)
MEPRLIPCLIISTILGLQISQATPTLEHGLIDMISMFFCFIALAIIFTGKWSKAAMGLAIGYGFAWTGHYFFELNKPATFTYPALSLMGDLMLWFQIATLQLSP